MISDLIGSTPSFLDFVLEYGNGLPGIARDGFVRLIHSGNTWTLLGSGLSHFWLVTILSNELFQVRASRAGGFWRRTGDPGLASSFLRRPDS